MQGGQVEFLHIGQEGEYIPEFGLRVADEVGWEDFGVGYSNVGDE